jgi:hypothetical protein
VTVEKVSHLLFTLRLFQRVYKKTEVKEVKMVKCQKCEVTRNESSISVEQRKDYVFMQNNVTAQHILIPNELLPDLSGLLEYIAGYHN